MKDSILFGGIVLLTMMVAVFTLQNNSATVCDENPSHIPDIRHIIPQLIETGFTSQDRIFSWTHTKPEIRYYLQYFQVAGNIVIEDRPGILYVVASEQYSLDEVLSHHQIDTTQYNDPVLFQQFEHSTVYKLETKPAP